MFASSMTIMRKIYRSLFVKILSPLLLQALAYRFFSNANVYCSEVWWRLTGSNLTCLTLASQGVMLLQSLTTVTFAKLRRDDRRGNSEIITSYYKIMLLLVPISLVALWWLAAPIVSIFNASYQTLSLGLFFLCASWLLYFAKGPLSTILAVNGYPSVEGGFFHRCAYWVRHLI